MFLVMNPGNITLDVTSFQLNPPTVSGDEMRTYDGGWRGDITSEKRNGTMVVAQENQSQVNTIVSAFANRKVVTFSGDALATNMSVVGKVRVAYVQGFEGSHYRDLQIDFEEV